MKSFCIFGPSTNNAYKSFNRTIKDRYVNWNVNRLSHFFKNLSEIVIEQ
jgi:hypothetical protein